MTHGGGFFYTPIELSRMMNDEYIPSNPWITAGICFLIASLSSVFAITSKRRRTLREVSIDAIQSGMVGGIICFSLSDYLPYNIILVLCGVLGLSGPSFTMIVVTTAQNAFLDRWKTVLEAIFGPPKKEDKDEDDSKNPNG